MLVEYLSKEEVVRINFRMIQKFGGSFGIRELPLLESAIARPQSGFMDYEAYSSIFEKAAAFIHSLVKNHPFVDGNKRTGIVAGGVFLLRNNYKLNATQKELVEITLEVATGDKNLEELTQWLEKHTSPIS